MRGLVPLPATARAITLAALVFGAGVSVEADGRALVARRSWPRRFRSSRGARRRASRRHRRRGPAPGSCSAPTTPSRGRARPADWLDATTTRGRLVLAALSALLALAAFVARRADGASYWIGIDALALVPVFFSGTSLQAPPDERRAAAALRPIAQRLETCADVRVAPYARSDELRLLVMPRLAMPGVVGVELAVAWERAGGASLATYEALVRVHEGSFAAAKMAGYAKDQRPLPGRKPEERVYRFEPAGPSVGSAAALVRELAEALRDRRLVIATPLEWEGAERRAAAERPARARCERLAGHPAEGARLTPAPPPRQDDARHREQRRRARARARARARDGAPTRARAAVVARVLPRRRSRVLGPGCVLRSARVARGAASRHRSRRRVGARVGRRGRALSFVPSGSTMQPYAHVVFDAVAPFWQS